MPNNTKHKGGPITNEGKAISSRNSTTHGLTQIGELSGHSFRVGSALDLLDKNIPLEKIMLRGGWKSETSAMRYLQSWNDSNWLMID